MLTVLSPRIKILSKQAQNQVSSLCNYTSTARLPMLNIKLTEHLDFSFQSCVIHIAETSFQLTDLVKYLSCVGIQGLTDGVI